MKSLTMSDQVYGRDAIIGNGNTLISYDLSIVEDPGVPVNLQICLPEQQSVEVPETGPKLR